MYHESEEEDLNLNEMLPEDIPDSLSLEDGMELYHKIYDGYYKHDLKSTLFRALKEKTIDAVTKGLLKKNTIEKLADEWFIDYGTMNLWGWNTSFKYCVANKLHEIHKMKYPKQHERLPQKNSWRGWDEDNCSCGFCSSSDSSD